MDLCGKGWAVNSLVWKAGPGGQSVRLKATTEEDEESQKEGIGWLSRAKQWFSNFTALYSF